MTDVAAVIPNRDGTGLVGPCIEAALAAGASDIVVVDDGSRDSSPREAEIAGARLVVSPGTGFAAAVNAGFASTDAPYVLVLNSDCFVDEGSIANLARALDSDPGLALCGAALREPSGGPAPSYGRLLDLRNTIRALLTGRSGATLPSTGRGLIPTEFVPLACALARRSAWQSVGGLDAGYAFYFEDYDVCWRLGAAGWRIALDWDAHAVHVGGASSSARSPDLWFRQYYRSLARYLRKRHPVAWMVFATVWVPYALIQAVRRRKRARAYLASIPDVLRTSRS